MISLRRAETREEAWLASWNNPALRRRPVERAADLVYVVLAIAYGTHQKHRRRSMPETRCFGMGPG
jgi:hypothetical protein